MEEKEKLFPGQELHQEDSPVDLFAYNSNSCAKQRPKRLKAFGLEPDVTKALAAIIQFGNGEKSPHIWFSFGLVLCYQGDRQLAQHVFRRAELLGHPWARLYGTRTSTR